MVAEEIVVSLSGGAPWGFRLQGGTDQQKPLQVAKVRRRSKACRAGLREYDELVAIGHHKCAELSHAEAMNLIDTQSGTLNLRVKRAPGGLHSSSYSGCTASPRTSTLSPTVIPSGITSPPDSEAYYGETDSDADTQSLTHRRQRRTPPHARSPARYDNQEEEETSEMSGYESATDVGLSLQGQWEAATPVGVPRRELLYQPLQTKWATSSHTPHTLTPHTLTPPPDQGLVEAEGEGDSGFQEAGGCMGLACPPLVSPERAREAMMMGAGKQLVPMVGPQQMPVSDELSTTYMDKARQAKLQRGESLVEKQVKEARTKCRSIASLLTDAPNPNSKGVLMFKKRRQRAKKYTLTCFGKAEGDRGGETEGETGGETEEEGGSSILSGSELDETGFSASFDPTWDTGYLDLLDRRSSACPSATTPTANHSSGLDVSAYQTPGLASPVCQNAGLSASELECLPNPGLRAESSVAKQPISGHPADMTPPAVSLTNGGPVAVSRANVLLTPPTQMPTPSQNGLHGNLNPNPSPNPEPEHHLNANQGVLNRTARPFTPGPASPRASVTSVMFRPPQPKPLTVASKPVAAVSMVTIQPSKHVSGPDTKRAVSSTSLYIPPRSSNGGAPPSVASPPSALSPSSSLPAAPFLQPATGLHPFSPQLAAPPSTPLSPSAPPTMFCSPAQSYAPPTQQHFPPPLAPASSSCVPASAIPPQHHTNMPHASLPVLPSAPPAPPPPPPLSPSFHPYTNMTGALTSNPHNAVAAAPPPQPAAATAPAAGDLPVAREQRIAVPASRTGILQDARRRPNKKPMFAAVQKMDVSPNPDLMCMVQNMDGHTGRGPESGATAAGETGHESGPEEDWLRLGAEACNFMQAQRGTRPPPVAPKPQAPQVPQLAGKGGQLFARRQNRMDRYVVERSPSVAAAPYSPAQTREPSPTPSLPATWKYSSNVRAPPPISYNPLLSPSCPPKAQKKPEPTKSKPAGSKAQKKGKSVDVMSHQPYQLNSSLFSYGGGASQGSSTNQQHGMPGGPQKTARVCEVKRFSTPPPTSNGPDLKVIAPRSATTLGEPLWRSELTSPPPPAGPAFFQPQWASCPLSPPPLPPPTAPLPQLPTFSSPPAPNPVHPPTVSHLLPPSSAQASKQFQSAPELSPVGPHGASRVTSSGAQPPRVPRPRFSTSSLGLQPSVWRPGSTMQ